jgi:signal transduction histidine kinase
MTRGASRYLGLIFIAVVIAPAVVLSLLAIRSIGREEAYIESQLSRTLSAEVDLVSGLVAAEVAGIQSELATAAGYPAGDDPGSDFETWRTRSPLVDVPFLLSPDFEVLWPRDDRRVRASESEFIEKQQAFLTNEVRVPVYENIAVAHKDDILGEVTVGAAGEAAGKGPDKAAAAAQVEPEEDVLARVETQAEAKSEETRRAVIEEAFEARTDGKGVAGDEAEPSGEDLHVRGGRAGETHFLVTDGLKLADTGTGDEPRESPVGEQTKKQAATSLFEQSEPAREKAYRAAQEQGQQISYRNVEPTAGQEYDKAESRPQLAATAEKEARPAAGQATGAVEGTAGQPSPPPSGRRSSEHLSSEQQNSKQPVSGQFAPGQTASEQYRPSAPATRSAGVPGRAGQEAERLRSIFISQPLKLSEIVARGASGLVPLAVDGETRLLYWQRMPAGTILGCLVDGRQVRERIIGALPGIYSPSRVLTVLDEKGLPLIVPQGEEARDWRRPFVAREISEQLPRWEVAAYLTDPGAISSRARTSGVVTWLLIFIMFVSIAAGGTLVVRSASAELKLAQQKTTFVANVSHELKTPLTSIRMFAEMLRDGRQPDEEKRKQYFDIMTSETERLTRLINNVLDFARAEQGKKRYTMRSCDLVGLASGMVESQRARLEGGGFTVGFLARADRLTVRADEEAIKQALVNLLSNAEKYSDQTRDIEVSVGREDGKAVISVSDRGVGIRAGEAEKIFSEFYRVDDALTSRVKGTGLGLTIARRIARDHGGDIVYAPREGGGSTFRMALPLFQEE